MKKLQGTIVGFDHGLQGAFAAKTADKVSVFDIPIVNKDVNIPFLAKQLKELKPDFVFSEIQQPMPKQGTVSTCTTCRNYGAVMGMLATMGLSTLTVRPSQWKREMGVSAQKESSRLRALQMHPALGEQLSRKRDHNRAEAVLLAEYGWRHWMSLNENPEIQETYNECG